MTLYERYKAWRAKRLAKWRADPRNYCQKHSLDIHVPWGCDECFLDQVRASKVKDALAKDAYLHYEAEVYAKALADELQKRGIPK